jgi:hypothetical protein
MAGLEPATVYFRFNLAAGNLADRWGSSWGRCWRGHVRCRCGWGHVWRGRGGRNIGRGCRRRNIGRSCRRRLRRCGSRLRGSLVPRRALGVDEEGCAGRIRSGVDLYSPCPGGYRPMIRSRMHRERVTGSLDTSTATVQPKLIAYSSLYGRPAELHSPGSRDRSVPGRKGRG